MLISEKVFKNPKFLFSRAKRPLIPVSDVRTKIINSFKFIVGEDFYDSHPDVPNSIRSSFLESPEVVMWGKDEEKIRRKRAMYMDFSKMPFPNIFIENPAGGWLVEHQEISEVEINDFLRKENIEDRISRPGLMFDTVVTFIGSTGEIYPMRYFFSIDHPVDQEDSVLPYIPSDLSIYLNSSEGDEYVRQFMMNVPMRLRTKENMPLVIEEMHSKKLLMGFFFIQFFFEFLLLINCANNRVVTYRLNSKEKKQFPKVFHERYTYRIVDLLSSKEVPEYKGLDDIIDRLTEVSKSKILRRAHYVRGHFVRRGGKVFWKRAHMRNRENLKTHGFSDHDYSLIKK